MLCGLLSGPRLEKSWQGGDKLVDFFEAKGVLEGLLGQLGIEAGFRECSDHGLNSTKQAAIVIDNNEPGVVGELHPKVSPNFEITEVTYLLEIDLVELLPFTIGHKMFQPIPRFPAMIRDIALVIGVGTAHQKVLDIIKSFPLVEQVAIFDVYSGEQVLPGKISLAYKITFQSLTHTLTDNEVNEVQQQILDKLSSELRAVLRS